MSLQCFQEHQQGQSSSTGLVPQQDKRSSSRFVSPPPSTPNLKHDSHTQTSPPEMAADVEFGEGRPPEISEVQQQSSRFLGEPIRVEFGGVKRAEARAAETQESLAPLGPAISEVLFGSSSTNHDSVPTNTHGSSVHATSTRVQSPRRVPNYVDRMEDRTRKDASYITFQAIRCILQHHERITAEDDQKRKSRLDEVQKEYFQQLDIVQKMRGVPFFPPIPNPYPSPSTSPSPSPYPHPYPYPYPSFFESSPKVGDTHICGTVLPLHCTRACLHQYRSRQ